MLRRSKNTAIQNWIRKLKEIVYETDELLDEVATEYLRRQVHVRGKKARKVCDFFSSKNQICFRLNLGHKIKDIGEKLNKVQNEISSLSLLKKEIVENVRDKNSRRETDSYVIKSEIIGREGDKENIVESLLDVGRQDYVSVIAIVGFGGLGKTALAQLVYNDEKVAKCFDKKMWVCVSEEFDVKLLVKKILNCVSCKDVANSELEQLQHHLRENLEGKRYLLVLDDVWNEDQQEWNRLKKYLLVGAPGSKILVTTRSTKIASLMGVDSPYELQGLPEDQAWALFGKLAFGEGHSAVNPNIIKIGQQIVKKCKGVPLAIRALAGFMYLKTKESDWSSILENDLWRSFQSRGDIIPVLKLSYHNLPIYLRQCFTYCAMFPKDHEFDKEILIYLWMAQGYIAPLDNNESLEDIGELYFNELLYRSFFQLSGYQCYKMHDLVHDLAQSIAKDSCIVLDNNMESVSERVHHVYYSGRIFSGKIKSLIKVKGMKTLFIEKGDYKSDYKREQKMIASNFQSLHALHLTSFIWRQVALESSVPKLVGNLKYLRYHNFSNSRIKTLPNSITNLLNLQTLILSNCVSLRDLPEDIKKLINLRCLKIDGCDELICMPIGLGKLTCLHKLSMFVVAKVEDEGSCSYFDTTRSGKGMLNELNGLNKLRGNIDIEGLQNVKNVELEANEVNLREKIHLQSLRLVWFRVWLIRNENNELVAEYNEFENNELLLEKLEPHPNLQELEVDGFMGVRFSSWLPNITNLVTIRLSSCQKLKHLPPLHQLPSLKTLHLYGLDALEYISDDDGPSPSELALFPSLQDIFLRLCPNLKGWWRSRVENEMPQFSCLSQLRIKDCRSLIMATSSSFKFLTLQNIWSLKSLPEEWLQNLTCLQELEISHWPVLASIFQGMTHLTCLQNLRISFCHELIIDGDDDHGMAWRGLSSLQSLSFEHLAQMISLPKGLQFVTTLQKLTIYYCQSFTALPDWIGNLTSLQRLELNNCPSLRSLPQGMRQLTSLQELKIIDCIHLSETCINENGIDWPKIAHIPNLIIKKWA